MSSDTMNPIVALAHEHHSPGEQYYAPFEITDELTQRAQALVALYPDGKSQSAVLPILHLVQEKFGYISEPSIKWTAEMTSTSVIHVTGVVTFYPGLHRHCPGKFHLRVCRTLSCALAGGEELFDYICEKTGIDRQAITDENYVGISPDGLWSIEAVECLANCGFGPNVLVNNKLYSQVNKETIDAIIAEYTAH